MKNTLLILFIVSITLNCTENKKAIQLDSMHSNDKNRITYLNNRNDSATWDLEMFENDKQMLGVGDLGPFEIGVFPVPNYELLGAGSFKGLENSNEEFKFAGKTILMNSFFVKENELNKVRLKGLKNEAFFQILVLTDTVDNENYQLNKSVTVSRNHPDYFAQGFVKTKQHRIDYAAFQTGTQNAYAIINTRIFDLNEGKTILISPQKDGTLRSLQIQSPPLSTASIVAYTHELIKDKNIITFFSSE